MLQLWGKLSAWPGGRWLFSRLLALKIPYTGSIRANVVELSPGMAVVKLRDRRRVRNHLSSVHAVALMNLGELSTGLAVMTQLPADARIILKEFRIEYLAKARGTLLGQANAPIIPSNAQQDLVIEAKISDAAGQVVCRAFSTWRVGPARRTAS